MIRIEGGGRLRMWVGGFLGRWVEGRGGKREAGGDRCWNGWVGMEWFFFFFLF